MLLLLPYHELLQLALALGLIFIGVFIATASSKYMYAGVLGSITVAIILFSSEVSLVTACYRTLEVIIGIIIAITVNRFIFPIHASKIIYYSFSQTMILIEILHQRLLNNDVYDDVLLEIFTQFTKQIRLHKEIGYEKEKVNLDIYKTLTSHLRQLYRYTCVIHEYINEYPDKRLKFSQSAEFKQLHVTIARLINQISSDFKNRTYSNYQGMFDNLERKLEEFKKTLNLQIEFRHASTLVFSLQMMIHILKNIEKTALKLI